MMSRRALTRLALNVGLDFVLAIASVPIARILADPRGDPLGPLWTLP